MLLPCSYKILYTYLVAQEKELPCDSCHAVAMQLQYWWTTAFLHGHMWDFPHVFCRAGRGIAAEYFVSSMLSMKISSCICRTGNRIAAEQQLKFHFWAGLFSQRLSVSVLIKVLSWIPVASPLTMIASSQLIIRHCNTIGIWENVLGCWCPNGREWGSPSPSPHCCQSSLHPAQYWRRGSQLSSRGYWSWRPDQRWRCWRRLRTCPPWWEHKPLRTEPQPVIVMVIIYLNYLESRMCMNTSNLFMQKSKSGLMSIRSALSDCKILFEMFLYFSTSDLRYFLESNLYFIQICIFWFVANRIKIWSSGDITSKVRRLSTRLSHLHCHIALDNPIDFVS